VELGAARLFVAYDEASSEFKIDDLSSDAVFEGNFILTVTLDDGRDQTSYSIALEVRPPVLASEESQEENAAGVPSNST